MPKPATASLLRSIREGTDLTPACYVDFGLESPRHFQALSDCVWQGLVTEQELDEALGNGKLLTALVSRCPDWKHLRFWTDYDILFENDDTDETDEEDPSNV